VFVADIHSERHVYLQDAAAFTTLRDWLKMTLQTLLRVNDWLNAKAPLVKRALRLVIPHKLRCYFADQKFDLTIKHGAYDVTFQNIYRRNWWGSTESVSGCGSELERTASLRKGLVEWLRNKNIQSLFDAPCGDFNWVEGVVNSAPITYIGGDIVSELIVRNTQKAPSDCQFLTFDILADDLPEVDAWLCRDLLIHFPNSAVQLILKKFANSNIKYFLATHFKGTEDHPDIEYGKYRPVNLCRYPFNWPQPVHLIFDGDKTDTDRYIGVWRNPAFEFSD
jgi:hypothetical protein